MSAMRKIIAEVAISADGYIARKDGSVDWLDRPAPPGHYGMAAFMKSIDTILWGRRTYDFGVKMGASWIPKRIKNYVFTNRKVKLLPGFEAVREPVPEFLKKLRATRGKNIWMMGGSALIGSFLDAGGVDEFSLHVIPVLIGEGIPLISPARRTVELKLISTKRFSDGVVHLHYKV